MSISNKPLFIGLAGTLNAGKDSFGHMLTERHDMMHISTSDMIRDIKKSAFGDTPEALLLRNDPYINDLRAKKGAGFLIEALHQKWQNFKEDYPGGYVASGIRAIGEAEKIIELGGIIVFIDADAQIRYQRSKQRRRDQNDDKTFEQFIASEESEMNSDQTDKSIQNISAIRKMANLIIENDGNDIDEFKRISDKKLQDYLIQV